MYFFLLQDVHDCYLDLFQTHLHFVSNNPTGLTYQVSFLFQRCSFLHKHIIFAFRYHKCFPNDLSFINSSRASQSDVVLINKVWSYVFSCLQPHDCPLIISAQCLCAQLSTLKETAQHLTVALVITDDDERRRLECIEIWKAEQSPTVKSLSCSKQLG